MTKPDLKAMIEGIMQAEESRHIDLMDAMSITLDCLSHFKDELAEFEQQIADHEKENENGRT